MPSIICPSVSFEIISDLFSRVSPCNAPFLETTILLVFLSALIILNSETVPSRYCVSLTGLISTSEPGRNALI